jgi:RNA polymerase sigma factor (sigma-70 family)
MSTAVFSDDDCAFVHRVARAVVRKIFGDHVNYREYLGAGFEGWQEAQDIYDPSRGASFKTVASSRIQFRILDEIRREMPYTRTVRGLVKNYYTQLDSGESANAALETVLSRRASTRFAALQAIVGQAQPATDDEDCEDPLDTLPDTSSDPRDAVVQSEMAAMVQTLMTRVLSWDEREVLRAYLEDGRVSRGAARMLGFTGEKANKIKREGLTRLRRALARRGYRSLADVMA